MVTSEKEATSDERRSSSDKGGEDLPFFVNGEPLDPTRTGDPRYSCVEWDDDEQWTHSYDQWTVKLPEKWQPVKGLGGGGFSATGHWEFTGTEEERGAHDSGINDVVIKQHAPVEPYESPEAFPEGQEQEQKFSTALRKEEGFMLHLTHTGSRHFPQLFDTLHRDVGTGCHSCDWGNAEVQRLVMEYFGGGDLQGWIEEWREEGIDEVQAWSIFVCLAKAFAVLDCGKENGDRDLSSEHTIRQWRKNVLVHFDIRPPNIFLDDHNPADLEHATHPRVVIGDLGKAQWLPRKWDKLSQDKKDGLLRELRSEDGVNVNHQPPEIRERCELTPDQEASKKNSSAAEIWGEERKLPSRCRKLGSCVNVWQLGELMWLILTRKTPKNFTSGYYSLKKSTDKFVDEFRDKAQCSEDLIDLVMRCLQPVPDDRPTPQEVAQEAIKGLRSMDPTAAEVASLARLEPRSDRLLRKAQMKDQNWKPVFPELRDIYLQESVPGFEQWYAKNHGAVEAQQPADETTVELDNGKPDPMVEYRPAPAPTSTENDAPQSTESNRPNRAEGGENSIPEHQNNHQIPMLGAVTSMASNGNVSQLPVDDVLGPAATRNIPKPRASLPRGVSDGDKTDSSQPSSNVVRSRLSHGAPSPTVHITVNVHPWCAGVGVHDILALSLSFPMTKTAFEQSRVEDLHTRVVAKVRQTGRQPILDDCSRYKYTRAGDDENPLSSEEWLEDIPNPGAGRLVLNLNLAWSLPLTQPAMSMSLSKFDVECRILSDEGHIIMKRHSEFLEKDMTQVTIKKVLDTLDEHTATQPDLPRVTSSVACVKLRDQLSNECIYDGRTNAPSSYDNQLVAPYCIAGEVKYTDSTRVSIIRLDIELRPDRQGQIIHPKPLVRENLLFLVHVKVNIHRDRPHQYKYACRHGTRVRQLRQEVIRGIVRAQCPSGGEMYIKHQGHDLGSDDSLADLLPESSPAFLQIVVNYVPPVNLLFWPLDDPSPSCSENNIGFLSWRLHRHTTVGDLKREIRMWTTQQIQVRHPSSDLCPALRRLVDEWTKDDEHRELVLRISGPTDLPWKGVTEPPLEDDMLVAEIDYTKCTSCEEYAEGLVQGRLDVLFKRPGVDGKVVRHATSRKISPLPKHSTQNCKPFGDFGTVIAPPLPEFETLGPSPASTVQQPASPISSSPTRSSPSGQESPTRSSPVDGPTALTTDTAAQRRPSEASDLSGNEVGWYSDASRDGKKLEVKVRCFRKGQPPKTHRCQKKDANGDDKTTNTLRDEIIAEAWYKPNIKAPMLRIRRPGVDQDLPDNQPLSKSLTGGMKQLLCIAGDWEKGFPPVPPGLAEPVEGSLEDLAAKPAVEQEPSDPDEVKPAEMIPIPEGSSDHEGDFSDMSDQPEGPKKGEIKVRCYRKGYRPWTFRTNLHRHKTQMEKDSKGLSAEILQTGRYGEATETGALHVRCTAEKPDPVNLRKGRCVGNLKVTKAIKRHDPNWDLPKPIKLYCRYLAEENGKVKHTSAPSSTTKKDRAKKPRQKSAKPRRQWNETAWAYSEDPDDSGDEDEIEVRCFCDDGKAAHSMHTHKGQKTVTQLKEEILLDDKDFYPADTKTGDMHIMFPGPRQPSEVIHHGSKLANKDVPQTKVFMCVVKGSKLDIPEFKPRPKSGAPKGTGGNDTTGKTSSNKRDSSKRDENDSDKDEEAAAPAPKRAKNGNGGSDKTKRRKRKSKGDATSNNDEKSTDADDEDENKEGEPERSRSSTPELEEVA